jgi:hypothetical protein
MTHRFWLVDNALKTTPIILRLHCKTTLWQKSLAEYLRISFKILTGLIGLQEGVVEQTTFMCHHGFSYAEDDLWNVTLDHTN